MTEKQKICLGFWKEDVIKIKKEIEKEDGFYYTPHLKDTFPAVPKAEFDKLKEEKSKLLESYKKELLRKPLATSEYQDDSYEIKGIPKEKVRKVLDEWKQITQDEIHDSEFDQREFWLGAEDMIDRLKKQLLGEK